MSQSLRRFFVLSTSITVIFFFSLLVGCGGSSKSTATNNPGGSGSSNSGSGGTGSNNGGSGGTGSSNSGSGGSNSGGSGSGSGGSGSGGSGSSSPVAYAYTANGTQVMAYSVNADGSLSTISGSPYAMSIQVQQAAGEGALVTNGANLYAVAAGNPPNNLLIAPITKSTGSLSQPVTTSAIAGDPNTSDFADVVTLDSSGSYLYTIVGLSDQDSGINVFNVGNSTNAKQMQYVSTGGSAGSPLVFTADNHYAYTFNCSARSEGVHAYSRASDGTLTFLSAQQVNAPSPAAGTGYCPAGIAASANGYLAIAWIPFQYASTVTVGNQISVGIYKINGDGSITLVPNSGVDTPVNTSANLSFDPSGTYLAVAGKGGLQVYSLGSGGTLTSVGSAQDTGVIFANVAWDKSNHLFAASADNQLYVFNSNNGALTPASGSPYAGGAGLAVLPLK